MRTSIVMTPLALVLMLSSTALADPQAECLSGIERIKAELAKVPGGPKAKKLKSVLDDAELETVENDWRECLGILKPVKKMLKR